MVRRRNELILGLHTVLMTWTERETPKSEKPCWRPQETECHCSPALTNWDRWRHFSGFVSLPTPRPFWNWIADFESCAAIPHNSIQALLEAQLLGNQMFWRSALFWLCCLSYTTTRHTRSFIHARVFRELHHWNVFHILDGSSYLLPFFLALLFFFASLCRAFRWIPLTSVFSTD